VAYFPNGTSGYILEIQCDECALFMGCPVYATQNEFNYKQVEDGQEELQKCINMLIGEDGTCKLKPLVDKIKSTPY